MTLDLWSRGSRVVAERLGETAAAIPDQPFVQVGGPWFTYAEINGLSGASWVSCTPGSPGVLIK